MTERPRSVSRPQVERHETVGPPVRPRPHPDGGAILWTPWKQWVMQTTVDRAWDVVLTQPALAAILDQVLRAEDPGVGGALGGKLFRCPTSGRRWVRVDSVWRSPGQLAEACDTPALMTALAPAAFDSDGTALVRVGWYHSHTRLGVALTDSERAFHEREFSKPWQFALILVSRSDPAGGIFQRGPGGVLPRTAYTPFYELPGAVRRDGSRQTMIRWQNYATDSRVYLVDPDSLRSLASRPSSITELSSPPPRLARPAARPRRSRHDPTAISTDQLSTTPEGSSRRPPWRRLVATAIGAAALLFAGWYGWGRYGPGADRGVEFSAPAGAEAVFLSGITSLEEALNGYAPLDRRSEASCDVLAPAFSRADLAFRSVAAAYATLSLATPGSGRVEYEEVALQMAEVSRHFAAAGCSAP